MNKQTLIRRLIAENNGQIYMAKNKIRKIVGMGDSAISEMMEGYDYTVLGKNHAHKYLVDDVADAIMRR